MTAGRSETATPPNPSPPTNFSSLGETPPTTPGLVPVSAVSSDTPHLFAPATGGLEHECAGTELVDPITGTVSTDGPPYVISPNSDHPSSGGAAEGETPAWVPADAVIHIDLVGGSPQGRAWVAGTGEVAVETLLGTDPASESSWGETIYSSEYLVPEGYPGEGGSNPAFIGVAKSMLLDSATMVLSFKNRAAPTSNMDILYMSDEGGNAAFGVSGRVVSGLKVRASTMDTFNVSTVNSINITVGAVNTVAMTVAALRLETALNGGAAVGGAVTTGDRPPGNPFAFAVFAMLSAAAQSITLYDPLPSTAGLSELSEVT